MSRRTGKSRITLSNCNTRSTYIGKQVPCLYTSKYTIKRRTGTTVHLHCCYCGAKKGKRPNLKQRPDLAEQLTAHFEASDVPQSWFSVPPRHLDLSKQEYNALRRRLEESQQR